jgi:hypothetical protein
MQTWLDAGEKPDLNWLPPTDIIALLSHPMFCLEDEYSVYKIVKSYIRHKGDGKLTSDERFVMRWSVFRVMAHLRLIIASLGVGINSVARFAFHTSNSINWRKLRPII